MILWPVLVFNLLLSFSGQISVYGLEVQSIPHLLRPYVEEKRVPSDGLFPGLMEDLAEGEKIAKKGKPSGVLLIGIGDRLNWMGVTLVLIGE